MERKWGLVVAGLAVTAVAGCSTAGTHVSGSPQAQSKQVALAQQATPKAEQARVVTPSGQARVVTPSGQAAFRKWWSGGGYRQYQHVASDLSLLIIKDTLRDDDATWIADAQHLVADATLASRHLPPVDGAGYRAGMVALAQAGRDALGGSYDKSYADVQVALPKLAAFNKAISKWVTSAPPA
jgi:hypothetical protein